MAISLTHEPGYVKTHKNNQELIIYRLIRWDPSPIVPPQLKKPLIFSRKNSGKPSKNNSVDNEVFSSTKGRSCMKNPAYSDSHNALKSIRKTFYRIFKPESIFPENDRFAQADVHRQAERILQDDGRNVGHSLQHGRPLYQKENCRK